jgi:hypothetical protein
MHQQHLLTPFQLLPGVCRTKSYECDVQFNFASAATVTLLFPKESVLKLFDLAELAQSQYTPAVS